MTNKTSSWEAVCSASSAPGCKQLLLLQDHLSVVELMTRPNGNDARRSQECPDKTTVQSASRPEEPSGGPRGHVLDSPAQRLDLQAVD